MQALTVPADGGRLVLAEADEPQLAADDVLVQVRAVSVNRGELHRLGSAEPGARPGWDFAGEVLGHGRDVDAPAVGERVFGAVPGRAWAERVAAPARDVAPLPAGLTWAQGAALPVAGLTATRVLALARRPLAEARVLVTGAAGGVGRLAIQLAAHAGAHVTAIVGSSDRAAGLLALGADEVAIGIDDLREPYDLILESVGGDSLARALALAAPGAMVVAFGNSSRAETVIRVEDFYYAEAALHGYYLWRDLERCAASDDLARLAAMVADGRLHVDVDTRSSWEGMSEVLERLRRRRIAGKAVLLLDGVR